MLSRLPVRMHQGRIAAESRSQHECRQEENEERHVPSGVAHHTSLDPSESHLPVRNTTVEPPPQLSGFFPSTGVGRMVRCEARADRGLFWSSMEQAAGRCSPLIPAVDARARRVINAARVPGSFPTMRAFGSRTL
jgi:hypothetical protein